MLDKHIELLDDIKESMIRSVINQDRVKDSFDKDLIPKESHRFSKLSNAMNLIRKSSRNQFNE